MRSEIATRSGMKLKVAAKIDKADRDYFERDIKPLLDHPLVEFVGEIGSSEKGEFLGNAAALLFPIQWPEPFGLVMIEAMACGTPVIAYPFGSVPEIIPEGVCGFLVRDIDQAVEAVSRLGEIDRRECRRYFELNFTDDRMAHDYLNVYQQLVHPESARSGRRGSFELDRSGIVHPQYYIATTSSPADDRARVLKYGRMFFVFDRLGDVQTSGLGEQGLFYDGTRHVSELSLNLWNARPLLLSSTVATNNFLFTADLANLDVLRDGVLAIQSRHITSGSLEVFVARLLLREVTVRKSWPRRLGSSDTDLDSMEISPMSSRFAARPENDRGRRLPDQISENSVILSYEGLDHVVRQTCIHTDAPGVRASESGLDFELVLRPKKKEVVQFEICCNSETFADSVGYTEALSSARFELAEMAHAFPQITSSNSRFSDWIARSVSDLEMMIAGNPERNYPYAGVPWFSTVFGRDGIITALQTLWLNPSIAEGVLEFLASLAGGCD